MYEQYIRNSLTTILSTWSLLLQIKDKEANNPINVVLISSIYELFTCICQLLHLEGNYILDVWEQQDFNTESTVDYIINHNFEAALAGGETKQQDNSNEVVNNIVNDYIKIQKGKDGWKQVK